MILQDGDGPCEGHIQVYHDNKWGWVGAEGWGENTEKVVCGSIGCGTPIKSTNKFLPSQSLIWLNELNCDGTEKDLWSCDQQGWNISQALPQTVKKIKCSNRIQISLDSGFKCSGLVKYSANEYTSGYFCGDKWGNDESKLVCNTLGCGEPKETVEYPSMHQGQSQNMKVAKCLSNETSLWQCVIKEEKCKKRASVTCAAHEIIRLKGNSTNVCAGQLEVKQNDQWIHRMNNTKNNTKQASMWCKAMFCGDFGSIETDGNVTCSDQVHVILKDGTKNSKCYGSVHIQRNDSTNSVCASQASWIKNGEVVCKELNCGTVVIAERKEASAGVMDSVSCTGDESSLWHCKATLYSKSLPCNSEPYVICSGSIQVQLKDGPGRCAGRVEIFYKGEWRKVMIKKGSEWLEANSKTVCKQLGCGDVRSTTEKFGKAKETKPMPKTVTCTAEEDNISKCIQVDNYRSSANDEEVGLVCTEHKVFHLDRKSSCSGLVEVQHGDTNYWLSGSAETWNKTSADMMCRQLNCGKMTKYTTVNLTKAGLTWHPDPSCSYKSNPLLDCGKSTFSNGSNTVAVVTCSGSKTITLTNKCWGNVNICVEDGCGGVCADSWTKDKSEKLCNDLECGSQVQLMTKPVRDFEVMFKSVHLVKEDDNMTMCSFVKNDGSCDSAYVVCSGSLKPQLNSSNYCSGKVEVNHEDKWHPVCTDVLKDSSTQSFFCKKLDCGDAIHSFDYKSHSSGGVSDMKCGNLKQHENLTECNLLKTDSCTHSGLQCSKWKKMALVEGDACSGVVVVYSEGKKATVSYHGWSEENGQRLCQDLKCGNLLSYRPDSTVESEFWNTTFNCTGVETEKNIWDCEKQVSPLMAEHVYIECTDKPEVKLAKDCHGELTIDGTQVCSTSWDNTYSSIVCHERNYSNAVFGNFHGSPPEPKKNYFHVRCEKHHDKIGRCERFLAPCSESLVTVYCTKNIDFTVTEKCGGQIQVTYDKELGGKVCYDKELPFKYKESLCKQLEGCGQPITKPKEIKTMDSREDINQWNTVLKCTNKEKHLRYCLFREPCTGKKQAEIYCEGYKPNATSSGVKTKVNVLAVILGVGLFLILAIVIFIFVRVYIFRKNRRVKNLPGFALRNDVEFESDEFQEIPTKEMDNVRSGENDARSTTSLPYDDIAEVSEVQPLTSQPQTTDDPHDSGIQDNKHEQNAKEDGVTYEVDDPQENYDDIEADLEPTQTTAEVHESPRNAPECSTNTPPDLVLGDDDYLVPGQDG